MFTKQLVEVIELHCAIKTSFTVELPPSDMKFTIFLNGELNNVATHFSSFANECHADCTVLERKFGTSPTRNGDHGGISTGWKLLSLDLNCPIRQQNKLKEVKSHNS